MNKENGIANLGIMIGDKTVWGRGYGSVSWRAVRDFMFNGRGIRKIETGCMAENISMRRVCHRTGMLYEGRRPHHFVLDGSTNDLVMYGQIKQQEELKL